MRTNFFLKDLKTMKETLACSLEKQSIFLVFPHMQQKYIVSHNNAMYLWWVLREPTSFLNAFTTSLSKPAYTRFFLGPPLCWILLSSRVLCKYLQLECIHFSLLLHLPPPETLMLFSGNVGVYTHCHAHALYICTENFLNSSLQLPHYGNFLMQILCSSLLRKTEA